MLFLTSDAMTVLEGAGDLNFVRLYLICFSEVRTTVSALLVRVIGHAVS